ncbi:MAG TPA: TRAP transporter large permease, partial [Kofleriaceae bacterium]|nr:TRAP transporter large permease [Kofleriaceae bacterium]
MKTLGALLALALVGAPLFVIVTVVTVLCWWLYQDKDTPEQLAIIIKPFSRLIEQDEFLAIPLFIAAGAIMTEGGLAKRLVAIARASVGWMPGGLGVAAVLACVFFAAISGSSPVTLIAVGSIMVPAMTQQKYPENFSLGLVMTAGSLGCLVPPAISLLIYALAVQGTGAVEQKDLFLAGLVPALIVGGALALYSVIIGLRIPEAREPFTIKRFTESLREGVWAVLLPVIILGGIWGGMYTPSEAGGVAVVYSLVVTVLIYRELTLLQVVRALAEAGKLMGLLILIIGITFSLNELLAALEVDEWLVRKVHDWNLNWITFLLIVNVILIVLGALMDSISATLLFAPLLAPIACAPPPDGFGLHPLHFGVVFVVNMEIGYLMPPVATNLFVASAVFKKPFGQVARAVMPTLGITCAALLMFMYVPSCSTGVVNWSHGKPFWNWCPWDESQCAGAAG